jgi:hypothetical protein
MLTVLRIEGDPKRLAEYTKLINAASVAARAHIDRAGRLVADLSKNKSDWETHQREVISAIRALQTTLSSAQASGDRLAVDTGVYARSHFNPGIAVAVDAYRFPFGLLGLLAELSIDLEFTVTSVSPD